LPDGRNLEAFALRESSFLALLGPDNEKPLHTPS
jgi:hypothetical protein